MGGGDLNLKKSWHPSTLRNIERVWKAEQKHEVEKQKIEQLQKELAEERAREEIQAFAEDQGVVKKKDERLEWMYQGPAAMVNREEYLMGRKIDKTFEVMQQQEKGEEPVDENTRFGSMFSNSTGNATVDLANKIREDPLFSIMKKEKEQRKSLLTNPVKMKQLQQILKMSLTDEKKNKKHKKDKKKRSHSQSSGDEKNHYKKSKKHKGSDIEKIYKKKSKKYRSSSESSESDHQTEKYIKKYSSREHHISLKSTKHYEEENSGKTYKTKRSDESNFYDRSEVYKHRNHKTNSKRDVYDAESKPRESHSKASHHSSSSYHKEPKNGIKKESKKKLSSEERERLLREMEENAKWREEQRQRNTKRYQEEAEREDNFQRVDAGDFLRPMLSKAAGKGSLENRVKQKVFSIQRNQSDMDKHFARR